MKRKKRAARSTPLRAPSRCSIRRSRRTTRLASPASTLTGPSRSRTRSSPRTPSKTVLPPIITTFTSSVSSVRRRASSVLRPRTTPKPSAAPTATSLALRIRLSILASSPPERSTSSSIRTLSPSTPVRTASSVIPDTTRRSFARRATPPL